MIDPTLASPGPQQTPRDPDLWRAAQGLEGAFLTEMLKSAGLGTARTSFGGGAGEEQFGSLMRDMQVDQMVEAGGIGLAENIYRSLVAKDDG